MDEQDRSNFDLKTSVKQLDNKQDIDNVFMTHVPKEEYKVGSLSF